MSKNFTLYAASGSCFNPEKIIVGKVTANNTFVSSDFIGNMNDINFWGKLHLLATTQKSFIKLMY